MQADPERERERERLKEKLIKSSILPFEPKGKCILSIRISNASSTSQFFVFFFFFFFLPSSHFNKDFHGLDLENLVMQALKQKSGCMLKS